MGFFPQISLNELITMVSGQDKDLLTELGPDLMKLVDICESDLLAQLRAKGAITDIQKQCIKVIKQYYIHHLLGPFLSKAGKPRFLTLQGCFTSKEKTKTSKNYFVQWSLFSYNRPIFFKILLPCNFFSSSHLALHLKF